MKQFYMRTDKGDLKVLQANIETSFISICHDLTPTWTAKETAEAEIPKLSVTVAMNLTTKLSALFPGGIFALMVLLAPRYNTL